MFRINCEQRQEIMTFQELIFFKRLLSLTDIKPWSAEEKLVRKSFLDGDLIVIRRTLKDQKITDINIQNVPATK